MKKIIKSLEKILELLFPKHCVGCGARGFLICEKCTKNIPSSDLSQQNFVTSVFAYSDPRIRKLIHLLKYKNDRCVANFFAPYLSDMIVEFLGEEKLFNGKYEVVLVPVPLSKKRLKQRGYNQSELLAREIVCKNSSFILNNRLVSKIKDTIPQAGIKKRSTRLINQKDCFAVLPNRMTKNEILILVDDVTTTGATLTALRDLLKKDGFRKIYAFTVAH